MILSTLAQVIGTAGLLTTAPIALPVALPVECQMTQAPVINIRPETKKIEYDVGKTSAQLSGLASNTISPYGLNMDQTTGGLRHDKPTMTTEIKFYVSQNLTTQTICMSYNSINIDILLQPKIYIAKEFNRGRCAREVEEHEKKHVSVDRKVINKYTSLMGKAIQKAVNETGVLGPYPLARTKEIQGVMSKHIESALSSVQLAMINEMNLLQQEVDSRGEYDRVSQYCKKSAKKALKNKQKELKKQQRRR